MWLKNAALFEKNISKTMRIVFFLNAQQKLDNF